MQCARITYIWWPIPIFSLTFFILSYSFKKANKQVIMKKTKKLRKTKMRTKKQKQKQKTTTKKIETKYKLIKKFPSDGEPT